MRKMLAFESGAIRVPLVPYSSILANLNDRASLRRFFEHPDLQEAIFIASPDLYYEMIEWLKSSSDSAPPLNKLELSLLKYLLRASFRCTPFGSFAGCSIFKWSDKSALSLSNSVQRHFKVDSELLDKILSQANTDEAIRNTMHYSPNNTLYELNGESRCIRKNSKGNYEVAKVNVGELMRPILNLAKGGAPISVLVKNLESFQIDSDTAVKLINELIVSGVLISDLGIRLTCPNSLSQIISALDRVNGNKIKYQLYRIAEIIERLNIEALESTERIRLYEEMIAVSLEQIKGLDKKKIIQLNSYPHFNDCELDKSILPNLESAMQLARYLNKGVENTNLKHFKEEFVRRFEEQEVPLVEALDMEVGICYPVNSKESSEVPLLDGITIQKEEDSVGLSPLDIFLIKQCNDTLERGEFVLDLKAKDIPGFKEYLATNPLGHTFGALVNMIPNPKEKKPLIELIVAGGASANPMLARFTEGSTEVNLLCQTIRNEEAYLINGLLTEVIHLPEPRLGNVMSRCPLSDFEIPILSQSSLDPSAQILISDILISVINNEIILRSRRLDKTIFPMFSSAQNYIASKLPIYRFLCDVRHDNKDCNLSVYWNDLLKQYKFLPRLQYKNVVLRPASWNLEKSEYEIIILACDTELQDAILRWRETYRIPRIIAIIDGENELTLDLESSLCRELLRSEMSKRGRLNFQEKLLTPDESFVKRGNELFASEIYIPFKRIRQEPSQYLAPVNQETMRVQREFLPLDRWVYYKVYCHPDSANHIIETLIGNCFESARKKKIVSKFFFIRYEDPHFHIRARFLCEGKDEAAMFHNMFLNRIKMSRLEKRIISLNIHPYRRELERYDPRIMEFVETIFSLDSLMTVNLMRNGAKLGLQNWLIALKAIDALIGDFLPNKETSKLDILNTLCSGYVLAAKEKFDKNIQKRIGEKYSIHKNDISNVLKNHFTGWQEVENLIQDRSIGIKQILPSICAQISLQEFSERILPSLVHMCANRNLQNEQVLQEAFIYELLRRHHTEQAFKSISNIVHQ